MTSRSFAAGAALALSLSLALPTLAQTAPSTDPAAVRPGAYKVEPSHTRILFSVAHMGFSTWYGDFTGASGTLRLDPARPANSELQVSVPVASVSTTNSVLDGELKSADWLDAARFPTMSFTSRQVTVTGPGRADVLGDLTLHGVTKPVTLHATFNAAGTNPLSKAYTVGFEARGAIKRSDFGITKYAPLIGDEVQLILSAPFEAAS
jgi:polyisoprenoid-binding protein YceI